MNRKECRKKTRRRRSAFLDSREIITNRNSPVLERVLKNNVSNRRSLDDVLPPCSQGEVQTFGFGCDHGGESLSKFLRRRSNVDSMVDDGPGLLRKGVDLYTRRIEEEVGVQVPEGTAASNRNEVVEPSLHHR